MALSSSIDAETRDLLAVIGESRASALRDSLAYWPAADEVPAALSEVQLRALALQRAEQDGAPRCFVGAGAYSHHTPAAAWSLATRRPFTGAASTYPCAAQGELQLLCELQAMLCSLTGMATASAVFPHGAWALIESVRMACRIAGGSRVLVPRNLHPGYRRALAGVLDASFVDLVEIGFSTQGGHVTLAALEQARAQDDVAALIVAQPNFFGVLEDVDELGDWARQRRALLIGLADPLSLGLLAAPAQWGPRGADIVVGELQPVGLPLAHGGACLGFVAARAEYREQMPGWQSVRGSAQDGKDTFEPVCFCPQVVSGRSAVPAAGGLRPGSEALAVAASVALRGAQGLARVADDSHANTWRLVDRLTDNIGVDRTFDRPFFREAVLSFSAVPVDEMLRALAAHNVLGGYPLGQDYPELGDALLIAATEAHGPDDFEAYDSRLRRVISMRAQPACPVKPKF
jgi:glycine dehydrogenase subunit 1